MHDVFISFSFADQKMAEKIVNLLTSEYHISCWICTRDVAGGQKYRGKIFDAIKSAEVVVFVQSSNVVESEEIPKEIGIALKSGKTIIPFKLDDSELTGDLGYDLYGINYIDATVPEFEERVAELAESISKVIGSRNIMRVGEDNVINALKSHETDYSKIFYGRNLILEDIRKKLQNDTNVIFLKGMGGIGKSEIAKQYAHKYHSEYDTIVFARYEDSLASLIANDDVFFITGLQRKTKIDDTLQTDEEYATDKLKLLKKICNERTLIIIDNYDVTHDELLPELVSASKYHILFTTRYEQERSKYTIVPVNEIESNDKLKKLVMGYCNPDYNYIDIDDVNFEELFRLTNRHTLVLQLIAQYMEESSCNLEEMVMILKERGFSGLSKMNLVHNNAENNGYYFIKALFKMTSLTENEKSFLRFLSIMPQQGINQKLLKKWCSGIFNECRTKLLKRSWIKFDTVTNKLYFHPIIREVIISELNPNAENCMVFLKEFVKSISENIAWNYSYKDKQMYMVCCYEIIKHFGNINKRTFETYYQMSVFLNFIDSSENTIKRNMNLIDISCSLFGNDSPETTKVLFRTGWCYLYWNKNDEAEFYLKNKAYPLLEKHINILFSEYIHCCCDIAKLYCFKYKEETDIKYLEEADKLGDIAYTLTNDCENQNKYFDARVRSGFAATTKTRVLIEKQDYSPAKKYIAEAKSIFEELEENNTDIASIMVEEARVQKYCGEYEAAIKTIKQTIDRYKLVTSEDAGNALSNNLLKSFCMLAECYEKINNIDSAIEAWSEALRVATAQFVEEHPTVKKIQKEIQKYNTRSEINA